MKPAKTPKSIGPKPLELPPGVKPSTERLSPKRLRDIADDRGIASGGRNSRPAATRR